MKAVCCLIVCFALILSLTLINGGNRAKAEIVEDEFFYDPPEIGGTKYYVDADAPDGGDGLTSETAWNTIQQVNAHPAFLPDDQILFKRGCTWEGQTLRPQGYGLYGHPIIVDSYGEGALPILDRKGEFIPGKVNGTVTFALKDQSYWTIRNIEIRNSNPVNPGTLEDIHVGTSYAECPMRNGLSIGASYAGGYSKKIIRGIVVENVVFSTIDTSNGDEGNCYKYRIDSKVPCGSGGSALSFSCSDASGGTYRSYMDNILVQNCTFHNVGGTAVTCGSGWKEYDSFTRLVIRGNRIYNDEDLPISTSGIYIVSSSKPVVEHNSLYNLTNGIAFQLCSDATAQYNSVVDVDGYLELTSRLSGVKQYWDGCGIDADCGTRGVSIFRYNYLERCAEGSFASFDYNQSGHAIIKLENNISYNCGSFLYYQCDTNFYDYEIRNNTIIRLPRQASRPKTAIIHVYNSVLDPNSMMFENNIFYYPHQLVAGEHSASTYTGNNVNGFSVSTKDPASIEGDPMLVLPENADYSKNISWDGTAPGTVSLMDTDLFTLMQGSPCLSEGNVLCGSLSGNRAPADLPEQPSEPDASTDPTAPKTDAQPQEKPNSSISPTTWILAGMLVATVATCAFLLLKPRKRS